MLISLNSTCCNLLLPHTVRQQRCILGINLLSLNRDVAQMCVSYLCVLSLLCTFSIVFAPVDCYRHTLRDTFNCGDLLNKKITAINPYTTRCGDREPSFLLVERNDYAWQTEDNDSGKSEELSDEKCGNTHDKAPREPKGWLSAKQFREVVEKEGFDEQLSEIILSERALKNDPRDSIPLHKCDWFNNDDAVDSEDELLMREYCAERVPNIDEVYKKLDPHGMRRYAPSNISTMEKTLGRVYEVNKPLVDEEKVSQDLNSYEITPGSETSEVLRQLSVFPTDEADIDESTSGDAEDTDDVADGNELGESSPGTGNALKEDSESESDSEEEVNCPEPYAEDPNADPNIETAIEDDAYRYFVTLPMLSWTGLEKEALKISQAKLSSYHKHYKETPRQMGTSSPYSVFASEPCSSVGVSDGECNMSLAEEVSAMETLKVDTVELEIEEYKHSDLLNDIDDYEAAEYPPIVEKVCSSEADSPVFTMKEYEPTYADVDVVNPRVYVSVPKSSVKLDEHGTTVLNEQFLIKRNRNQRLSGRVSEIPLNAEPQIGTILVPNEFGYLDQNIRYLADEIGVISRSLVFVPDISSNDLMFSLTMNRLIKLIQMAFNVDRIAVVALGSQGNRVIHYIYTSMKDTVDRTLNDFRPLDPKMDPDRYRKESNINRLQNIVSRQSTPMLEDIMQGIQRLEHNSSIKAAAKSRDYNLVKPLCNILQSIVILDSVQVNFKEVAQLGVPVLFNMSNRNNLFDRLLRLDDPKFLSKKAQCTRHSATKYLEVFDYVNGAIPEDLAEVLGKHVHLRYIGKDKEDTSKPDIYDLSTNHTGIDVKLNFFTHASKHFYMKKPWASAEEMKAIGDAIMTCADWINSWSF